ncbi:helix-turn-helix domain-containing protein [Nocardia panacis]|uniref:helix-turn-helix domain-containing protein n=1 Tax=Nocardia panacis TaxID=2340916 RepID=UPI001EF0AA41|nr:helix-turn-helix transcriptional regulator [Nocardia panacis]
MSARSANAGPKTEREEQPSSTLPRRQLGRHLRDWRAQAGLTIAEASRLMEWGASTLQRLEKGQADRIRTIDVRALCRIYGIPDAMAEGLTGLAQQAAVKSWWHAYGDLIPETFEIYVGLEAWAAKLTAYQSEVMLGQLQTADYARALIRLGGSQDEQEVQRRVQLRMQRQALLTRPVAPANLDVVLDESVLRRTVGGARVMAAQLRHLADLSTRPNLTLRILPFTAGIPLGDATGPFTVLDFGADGRGQPVEPPVVYVEGFTGDLYLERPADVRRYHLAHERLRRCALDIQASRHLLRQLAKEYVHE